MMTLTPTRPLRAGLLGLRRSPPRLRRAQQGRPRRATLRLLRRQRWTRLPTCLRQTWRMGGPEPCPLLCRQQRAWRKPRFLHQQATRSAQLQGQARTRVKSPGARRRPWEKHRSTLRLTRLEVSPFLMSQSPSLQKLNPSRSRAPWGRSLPSALLPPHRHGASRLKRAQQQRQEARRRLIQPMWWTATRPCRTPAPLQMMHQVARLAQVAARRPTRPRSPKPAQSVRPVIKPSATRPGVGRNPGALQAALSGAKRPLPGFLRVPTATLFPSLLK
mmetsp:Transcript_73060/g.167547  ORF Transcript_73060/g.167547 Transcript_73060/m.167547 type:complete len:274 (-) Transcript_73060:123-944(-)